MKHLGTSAPLRVFVVENHEDSLKYLCLYLERLGCDVRSAQTMGDALSGLAEVECDVLLSDIGLPDGDGWELLERAQLPARVYAVAMSGLGRASDRARSQAAGYREHLIKPFAPDELKRILTAAAAG